MTFITVSRNFEKPAHKAGKLTPHPGTTSGIYTLSLSDNEESHESSSELFRFRFFNRHEVEFQFMAPSEKGKIEIVILGHQ